VCTVSSGLGGSTVSCDVSGTTISGSPGDVLGQFTLPRSVARPIHWSRGCECQCRIFKLYSSGLQPSLSGMASLLYEPQCIPNPFPPQCAAYREETLWIWLRAFNHRTQRFIRADCVWVRVCFARGFFSTAGSFCPVVYSRPFDFLPGSGLKTSFVRTAAASTPRPLASIFSARVSVRPEINCE
jgi:hypothetical protein